MKFFQVFQYLTMFLFCFSDVVAINVTGVITNFGGILGVSSDKMLEKGYEG